MVAVAPSTGNVLWTRSVSGVLIDSPTLGADGTIYFGDSSGAVTALNPDGSLLWKYQPLRVIHSSPAVAKDGTVYVAAFNDKVYAITPVGTLRWGADGTIYVGSVNGRLYALGRDGAQKWSFATGARVLSSPAIDAQGRIYFGSRRRILGRQGVLYRGSVTQRLVVAAGLDAVPFDMAAKRRWAS